MPKQKTHSGAKKRFRFTGSGKIMKPQPGAHVKPSQASPKRRPGCFAGRLQDPQDPSRQVNPPIFLGATNGKSKKRG
jgi:large subunit ribosomal protein L35